jgi:hypothetical protein
MIYPQMHTPIDVGFSAVAYTSWLPLPPEAYVERFAFTRKDTSLACRIRMVIYISSWYSIYDVLFGFNCKYDKIYKLTLFEYIVYSADFIAE